MFWIRAFEVLFLVVIPAVQAILKYLGIAGVTYFGISIAMGTLLDYMKSSLQGAPAQMLSILGLLNFDVGVNIYLSALTAYMVMKGLDKATDKKKSFVFKA